MTCTRIVFNDDQRDFLDYRQGSGKTIEIFDICVGSDRRTGIGRAMVYQLYKLVDSDTTLVWAITRSSNFIAQRFYEELGFRVIGVLRDFYQDEHTSRIVDAIMYGVDKSERTWGKQR